jgi:orotidine-5'-phosphate decarboxylase
MKLRTLPQTPWLLPEEHEEVVVGLIQHGLLKFSNARNLPLKKGGETDVYINLRDARNSPAAIEFVAGLYAMALRRLDIARFIEIPDAVSCFAGPLSMMTGLPYLTIREQPKAGRATDARVIGQGRFGEPVVIFDDVITDGDSKIVPIRECRRMHLNNLGLVVLVDRQQGWQDHLAANGILDGVWAGMTLHDVRRVLVERRYMERCDAQLEEANPLILALDAQDWESHLQLIDAMRPTGCILKVNDLVMNEGIARLLPNLSVYGRVMLDLKLHEIPNTVTNVCRHLHACPPWAVTVHASGGGEMVAAAVKALAGVSTNVLAITVLTSMHPDTCEEIYHRRPRAQVLHLTRIAAEAGANGVVCAPAESAMIRKEFPDLIVVNPGVRSEGVAVGDQKRVSTPAGALAAGANHIVVGRQVTENNDPPKEARRILVEELGRTQFA